MNTPKQDAIIIDIHGTLLNKDGSVDDNLLDIVKCLSHNYYILLLTSHFYKAQKDLIKEIKMLDFVPDATFYSNSNSKHDDDVKKYLYNKDIAPLYNVIAIIDNSKKVIKKFHKMGINTMRFKSGDH